MFVIFVVVGVGVAVGNSWLILFFELSYYSLTFSISSVSKLFVYVLDNLFLKLALACQKMHNQPSRKSMIPIIWAFFAAQANNKL